MLGLHALCGQGNHIFVLHNYVVSSLFQPVL